MVVLDANILIRAVLGRRVRQILETHFTRVRFFALDTAFAEARAHLPEILDKRAIHQDAAMALLDQMVVLIGCIDAEIYGPFETIARERLARRDEEDWPVLATALALERPIWTEDADFFGAGVATSTTDGVELLLREFESNPGEPPAE